MSDVNLSGAMNGVALAHHIKEQEHAFQGDILLMSGLPKDELEQKYHLKSNDLFISKPFTIKQLEKIFQISH